MLLKQDSIQKLRNSKNLLAFSAGSDSSALFFLLLEADITFDIAIVDYNLRASSKDEVAYAKELAAKYEKKIYTKSLMLDGANFESSAREARYSFFEDVLGHGYDSLITAHQLNDKVEWLRMSFCRGSGIVSMSGMTSVINGKYI